MYSSIAKELSAFMQESGKSQQQIARETGLSTAVISQFLRGTYPGDIEKIADALKQYLRVGKERLKTDLNVRFYEELHNTCEVVFACEYAHRNNDIALVSGDAGAGKTTALKHYADTNTGVILVTANACITSCLTSLKRYDNAVAEYKKQIDNIGKSQFIEEVKAEQRKKALEAANEVGQKCYAEIDATLEKINELVTALNAEFQITPELTNALAVSEALGNMMTDETRRNIVNQFVGQKQQLLILRTAFKRHEIKTSEIDKLLFIPEEETAAISDMAFNATLSADTFGTYFFNCVEKLYALAQKLGIDITRIEFATEVAFKADELRLAFGLPTA